MSVTGRGRKVRVQQLRQLRDHAGIPRSLCNVDVFPAIKVAIRWSPHDCTMVVQLCRIQCTPLCLQRASIPPNPLGVTPVLGAHRVPHVLKLRFRGDGARVGGLERIDCSVRFRVSQAVCVLRESCTFRGCCAAGRRHNRRQRRAIDPNLWRRQSS